MYGEKLNMLEIFEKMTNGGLSVKRPKGSKFAFSESVSVFRPGKVIGINTKSGLKGAKGLIIGSVEALVDNHKTFTHITPNVFRSAKYIGDDKVIGHREDNLKQINAFVIDIDGIDKNKVKRTDIVFRGMEAGLQPTIILDTPHGYQVQYYLKNPIFIKKNDNKAVKMAKRISMNLREHYRQVFEEVDMACNHFGFFRCPKEENILSYSPNSIHSLDQFIEFSMEFEKLNIESRKLTKDTAKVYDFASLRSIHEPWFHMLINCTHIKGSNGQIGRDNAIFTMSLQLYAGKVEKEEALLMMQKFNSNLEEPLDENIVVQKVNSAYSGQYKGAKKQFIDLLLYTWCEITDNDKNNYFFRHHAKPREERERSHWYEWEGDMIRFINENAEKGKVVMRPKEVISALNIPRSTYYDVLKLTKTVLISKEGSKVVLATKASLYNYIQTLIEQNKNLKAQYRMYLTKVMPYLNLQEKEQIIRHFTIASDGLKHDEINDLGVKLE